MGSAFLFRFFRSYLNFISTFELFAHIVTYSKANSYHPQSYESFWRKKPQPNYNVYCSLCFIYPCMVKRSVRPLREWAILLQPFGSAFWGAMGRFQLCTHIEIVSLTICTIPPVTL